MNVERVWAKNITGRDVVVTILDDGLEKDHPDLVSNYVSISLGHKKALRHTLVIIISLILGSSPIKMVPLMLMITMVAMGRVGLFDDILTHCCSFHSNQIVIGSFG